MQFQIEKITNGWIINHKGIEIGKGKRHCTSFKALVKFMDTCKRNEERQVKLAKKPTKPKVDLEMLAMITERTIKKAKKRK